MKKLLVIILAVLLVSFTYFGNGFVRITERLDGDVIVYTADPVVLDDIESVLNVEHYMTSGKVADLAKITKNARDVIGVSIKLRGSVEELNKYLKMYSATLVKAQTVGETQIYYAYSPRVKDKVTLFGENINLEFAFTNGVMTIGCPIIIGGY